MKVAIVGSRTGVSRFVVENYIRTLPPDTIIISGGAAGVDTAAAQSARLLGLLLVEYFPDYTKHGKAAPWIRNGEIATACDKMVAFWNGKSRGTLHAVDCARQLGKEVEVHGP